MQLEESTIDLHTSEAPIETSNLELTMGELGLRDCTIDGVLEIYAIVRKISGKPARANKGQATIFIHSERWVSTRSLNL